MFLEGGKNKDVHNERQNQQSAEKTFKEKDIDICNEYINKESLLNASKGSLGEGPQKKNYEILDICPKQVYPTYLVP